MNVGEEQGIAGDKYRELIARDNRPWTIDHGVCIHTATDSFCCFIILVQQTLTLFKLNDPWSMVYRLVLIPSLKQ